MRFLMVLILGAMTLRAADRCASPSAVTNFIQSPARDEPDALPSRSGAR